MKIFLLGASGFVGTNVLPDLLRASIEVVALYREPKEKASCPTVTGLSWMSIHEALLRPVTGFDSLLSFAGIGSPAAFEQQPQIMAAAEIDIAVLISNLAARYGLRSVQFLSSAGAVYGEGSGDEANGVDGYIFTERSECNPVAVYGRSKLAAERYLAARLAVVAPGTVLSILRATNIYGIRYSKAGQQGLINALIDRWRGGLPITQYGDGLIYRDYLFATDLAEAHLACLRQPVAGLFNIGVGRSHSILDVIAAVETATGSRFERQLLPARTFDVRYMAVSIDKARTLLGWSPQVSLAGGISRILDFQPSN